MCNSCGIIPSLTWKCLDSQQKKKKTWKCLKSSEFITNGMFLYEKNALLPW